MGWHLWRWAVAGYAASPLFAFLLGERQPLALASVMMWTLAGVGLIVGMLCTGWFAWLNMVSGLVLLVMLGLWLESHAGGGVVRLPTARVMTTRRPYLFPTSTWSPLIGRILLAIAGAALLYVG
jgi:hypothetical protein